VIAAGALAGHVVALSAILARLPHVTSELELAAMSRQLREQADTLRALAAGHEAGRAAATMSEREVSARASLGLKVDYSGCSTAAQSAERRASFRGDAA